MDGEGKTPPELESGETPLFAAVVGGHLSTVVALIEAHARVNTATLIGETPLHAASAVFVSAHRTHFSHMSHPTFPISHLLFCVFSFAHPPISPICRTPLFPYLTF